jgi:hypothetical protein
VTRLGKFLPIGRLFTLGSFFENCRIIPHFGQLFPRYKLLIDFDKYCVVLQFGQFFHELIWSPCWRGKWIDGWQSEKKTEQSSCFSPFCFNYKVISWIVSLLQVWPFH